MIRRQPPKGATQHSFYRRRRIKVIFLAVHCVGGLRPIYTSRNDMNDVEIGQLQLVKQPL
jgi:hypothetical protein